MLNCQDYFILISGLIDNELSAIERKIVRQHLDECEKCRKEWIMLFGIQDEISSTARPKLPANILERVNQEIEKKEFDDKRLKFTLCPSRRGRTIESEEINYVRTSRKTA